MANTIVCLQSLTPESLRRLTEVAPGWTIVYGREEQHWKDALPDAAVVIGWNETVERALKGSELKSLSWVHSWGAGVDGFPFEDFARRSITLTNSSGVHAIPIAESVLGMMLALTRKIDTYVRQQQQHRWHHAGLRREMSGSTVVILGVGAIGAEVARLAKAFGMRTVGVRKRPEALSNMDVMATMEELVGVLPEASYVVNTLPLTEDTFHIVGEREFAAMREDAYYINIGRGATTDTEAMLRALTTGGIAGAGLDVFETEPLPADHPLWDLDNVIVTPHTTGSTLHYEPRMMDIVIDNLASFVAGLPLKRNVVDLAAQY